MFKFFTTSKCFMRWDWGTYKKLMEFIQFSCEQMFEHVYIYKSSTNNLSIIYIFVVIITISAITHILPHSAVPFVGVVKIKWNTILWNMVWCVYFLVVLYNATLTDTWLVHVTKWIQRVFLLYIEVEESLHFFTFVDSFDILARASFLKWYAFLHVLLVT